MRGGRGVRWASCRFEELQSRKEKRKGNEVEVCGSEGEEWQYAKLIEWRAREREKGSVYLSEFVHLLYCDERGS